jgi:ectoine hydroxylase-related dioxygenase (phytanoyl-CoA dioxygenase family)
VLSVAATRSVSPRRRWCYQILLGPWTGDAMRLSDGQLRRYDEDGFLAIEHLIDDDTVAELREAYGEVLNRRVETPAGQMLGGRIRVIVWPAAAHAAFAHNRALAVLRELADQVLGEASPTFDMLIYKPPGDPEITPWHQDMAYSAQPFAPAGSDIPSWTIRFWIALDDVDEENGCMYFLPGYHREPLREHHVIAGDPSGASRLLELADPDGQVDLQRAVTVPLPAGGATMHSYGTPHFAGPNRSADRPRRAYIVNFANPNRPPILGSC